ncbi:glycosyltransferase [Escherichia coli]
MGVSITSVLLHNNDVSFVFHVFIDDIPEADIQRLAQIGEKLSYLYPDPSVNCERLKALPTTKNWSIAMYFRFVIADYLSINKINLYLDADIACQET